MRRSSQASLATSAFCNGECRDGRWSLEALVLASLWAVTAYVMIRLPFACSIDAIV